MAKREEVISVCAMHDTGALTWRFDPEHLSYQYDSHGPAQAKSLMRAEFEKALERADNYYITMQGNRNAHPGCSKCGGGVFSCEGTCL